MSALTELTIPADALALERAFEEAPALRVELARTVTCDENLSFLWVAGVPASRATPALESDPTVETATRLSETDVETTRRALYTVEWNDGPEPVLESLARGGAVLEASAASGRWHVTTVYPDHDSLTAAYRSCEVPVEVRSVRTLSERRPRSDSALTDTQYEALSSALAHDFYEIPRNVTLSDLASDLGVSHQAVSERLRRSHGKLVKEAVEEAGLDEGSEDERAG